MEPDKNIESLLKRKRPPSYGSMKSDDDEEEEEEEKEEALQSLPSQFPAVLPESTVYEQTGIQRIRSGSPETLFTMSTMHTIPPGAFVIDTRFINQENVTEQTEDDDGEELEEEEDGNYVTNSPEPPEPVEPDETMQIDENGQPGSLHPEQEMRHVFQSIMSVLGGLTADEYFHFKMWFSQFRKEYSMHHVLEGDLLDFVDKILEDWGQDSALMHTITTLKSMEKKAEAENLENLCKRALIRLNLKKRLTSEHKVIREGVCIPGRQNLLDSIYVEPEISTCGYGGVDPSHEFRAHPPSPLQVPSVDTIVNLNNLFRLRRDDGQLVRTVLTTGIPGIGMSVSVGKFCMDWVQLRANKDLQFVIKLSFSDLWFLRNKKSKMSIMDVIEYFYPFCKGMECLKDSKFLIIMDSFDCYQAPLPWKNAPVIRDCRIPADHDDLLVNILRGTLFPDALVWILGRRAAVSKIPSQFIDVVTEIQGFSDEMKDEYLTKRFSDAELAAKIVTHYKRLPTLHTLARQPFVCWMVASLFERCYRHEGYGLHPPRLTPFYINILIVQTNRRLQFYKSTDENQQWSSEDKELLVKMGKIAFDMLERNTGVFTEEDINECGLSLTEVTVFSGICTELPTAPSEETRKFCFIHFTFQEFMAALYIFTMFRLESKNMLGSGGHHVFKMFNPKENIKSVAGLVQSALDRTLKTPMGQYDMFLRFLCGLLSSDCHGNQLVGYLYPRNLPKIGLGELKQLLEQTIATAQKNNIERVGNLEECLREMTQEDD